MSLDGVTQEVSGALTDAELRASAVPVSGPLTDAQLRAAAVPVSAASLPLPTGAATDAGLAAILAAIADLITEQMLKANLAETQPVSLATVPSHAVTGPLTDTELRATAVPVSGPVTDTQLRATAVPVSLATVPSHAVTNAGTFAVQPTIPVGATTTKKYYTSAGAVTDGIVWSPAAGKRWYVKSLYVQVSADATVTFEDDLAAGDSAVLKSEFAAKSGTSIFFDPPLSSGEDAADLLITTSAGNVYVTVTGYEA